METKQSTYINHLKNAKDKKQESMKGENVALLDEIKKLQKECLSLSKEKIDIAQQNYELVYHCAFVMNPNHIAFIDRQLHSEIGSRPQKIRRWNEKSNGTIARNARRAQRHREKS